MESLSGFIMHVLHACISDLSGWDYVGILVMLVVGWSVYRGHKNGSMKWFNLFDLLMENGRVSKVACVFLGTWAACTWAFLKHTGKAGLDAGTLMAYGGIFVTPLLARFMASNTNQPMAPPPKEGE